jgi:hypothetical protein
MDDEGDVSSESSTGGESPPHIGFDVSVPGRSNRTGGIASIALDGSVPTLDEIVDVKLVERGQGDVKVDLWDSLTPIEGENGCAVVEVHAVVEAWNVARDSSCSQCRLETSVVHVFETQLS